jgi:hypothetical protein
MSWVDNVIVNTKKTSNWEFVTFGSGGLSLGVFAAEGGKVVLKNPVSRQEENFYYGGAGAGLALGLKLPKIGKVQINTRKGPLTAVGGPTAFPSKGTVLVTTGFVGDELTGNDIKGVCCFTEIGAGVIGGGSGCVMFVGLNPLILSCFGSAQLLGGLGTVAVISILLASARGIILMAGANIGIQAQIGGAFYFGYLG